MFDPEADFDEEVNGELNEEFNVDRKESTHNYLPRSTSIYDDDEFTFRIYN